MKKALLLMLGLFTCFSCLYPQTFGSSQGTTRAVVIGISDYQDEQIPDLRYAHKDAEAFVAYLQSDKGGRLEDQYIRLLVNEQAKAGDIIAQFDWLIAESKAGDKVIIYFSGHGDVERVTRFQRGYLLAYDSPPAAYMAGGTLSVQNLQDIITSLSENEVQVIFISDACRSGKLAGSDTGGAQATTAALTKQFANEIKILSCQPNEYSLEGAQWGGGRGCFSYHLVDGLYGLADLDNDRALSLLELERYLEDKVPRETAPQSQIPMSVGNKSEELAFVDKNWLEKFKLQKDKERPTFDQLASRNIEEALLTNADTSIREQYRLFSAALEKGDLLAPKGASADDYFRKLIAEPSIRPVHGLLKRNFAAALQNESQQVINALMKSDPEIWSDVYSRPFEFDHIPAYLARATEILGERHYFYKQLKAKQAYFEAKTYRKDKYPNIRADSLTHLFIAKCEEALQYDPEAAYVYLELGYHYYSITTDLKKAYKYSQKGLELSPNWVLALHLTGRLCWANTTSRDDAVKSRALIEKALEIDSTFIPLYLALSQMAIGQENQFYRQKFLEKILNLIQVQGEKTPTIYYGFAADELLRLNRYEEAERLLLRNVELTGYQNANDYFLLSILYRNTKRYSEAKDAIQKSLTLAPLSRGSNNFLANLYLWYLSEPEKAGEVYLKVIELDPTLQWPYNMLGRFYSEQKKYEEAEKIYQKAVIIDNTNIDAYVALGCLYYYLKRYKDLETLCKKSIELKPIDHSAYNKLTHYLSRVFGRWEEAEKIAKEAIAKDSTYLQGHLFLAAYFRFKRDYHSAIDVLERYFPLYSNFEDYHFELGYSYWKAGQFDKAASHFQTYISSNPFNAYSYNIPAEWFLAKIYQDVGKEKEAKELFKTIIEHWSNPTIDQWPPPARISIVYAIAASYLELGDLNAMEQAIEKALLVNPDETKLTYWYQIDYELHYQVARVYSLAGRSTKAIQALELTLKNEEVLKQGYSGYGRILAEEDFDNIRELPEFKALMKQYFPEQVKE